jgi:lysophospholipid acyltransferase (LPLAT)-like uncharacterized protein
MNTDNTLSILDQLFSSYPNTKIEPATVAVYVRLLQDIPPADLQTIVDQAIATSEFLPTIAKLRDTWHAMNHADQITWADAWDAVMAEMRRIGSYGSPHFEDELTARVVKSMGWKALCASENTQTDRAQFRDMYNAIASRQESAQKLLPQARELAERSGGMISMRKLLGTIGE